MEYNHALERQKSGRKRSRSPRKEYESRRDVERRRSRSLGRHKNQQAKLPFDSRHLHKRDLESYEALFAEYLDLQKQIDIAELGQDEVKGRWKSFLGKWNRGELAEGWYAPDMKEKADERYAGRNDQRRSRKVAKRDRKIDEANSADEEEEEEAGYGPSLPGKQGTKRGPTTPNLQDLQHRHELAAEDRESRIADLRHERKQDRQAQKERLEELVPRADPGSRERQLEKKREVTASNRSFAEAKETGAEEVGDDALMGDDGVDGYKARLKATEKQKNEREIKKEENLRARAAEREERMKEHRVKEEKTMDMLRSLARQRFGGGDG